LKEILPHYHGNRTYWETHVKNKGNNRGPKHNFKSEEPFPHGGEIPGEWLGVNGGVP
jgi:hypothetical protein